MWALVFDGRVSEVTATDPIGIYHPSLPWHPAPDDVRPGMLFDGSTYCAPPPPAPSGPVYVPFPLICGRLRDAGLWTAFAQLYASLPIEQQLHLQTLELGVAPDDPEFRAGLEAIGADPAVILAP